MENGLTAERLSSILSYDPETGLFLWLESTSPRIRIGEQAGSKTQGYINIQVDGVLYRAHRLAWLHVYGEWPEKGIDHINGISSDNRIANLREASQSQNTANARRKVTCQSGFKGVTLYRNKWVATIGKGGKKKHLGCFDTPEAAHAAYSAAAIVTHGAFARAV
jgi:hypothetical protein